MQPNAKSTSPLVTITEAAALAERPVLSYRRTILTSKQHPRPINNCRPALFRRTEILKFLGIDATAEASHV